MYVIYALRNIGFKSLPLGIIGTCCLKKSHEEFDDSDRNNDSIARRAI